MNILLMPIEQLHHGLARLVAKPRVTGQHDGEFRATALDQFDRALERDQGIAFEVST